MEEALEAAGVPGGARIAMLSQGQKRGLQLAAALIASARVYLLDDPGIGLDEEATRTLVPFLVEKLAERRAAVVVSTRSTALASLLAERCSARLLGITKYSHTAPTGQQQNTNTLATHSEDPS